DRSERGAVGLELTRKFDHSTVCLEIAMRCFYLAAVLCVLLVAASVALAQDEARAIVEKAIQAQGGETKVAKLRAMRITAEGTADLIPGQPSVPFTIEDTWQMPDRYKTSSTFQLQGKKVTQTQVINGDEGWIQTGDQVQDIPKAALAEMKEQKY